MAAHGRLGGLAVKDSSTTSRNISSYLTSIDFSQSADTAEVTTFNSTGRAKIYVPGNKDATFSAEGIYDPVVDGYLNGIVGLTKAYSYYAATTAPASANYVRYTGSAICTGYSGPKAGIGDAVTFSCEFQNTGKITRSTASS